MNKVSGLTVEENSLSFFIILILLSFAVIGTVPSFFSVSNMTIAQAQSPSLIVINSPTNITQPGNYQLGSDLSGTQNAGYCIGVFASDVVLNGMGHSLSGNGNGIGIYVSSSTSNVSIENIIIKGYNEGVYLKASNKDSIANDVLYNNNIAIYVKDSKYVNVGYATINSYHNPDIYVYGSKNVSIIYGTFYDHSNDGVYNIYIINSNYSVLSNNSITSNGGDLVYLKNFNYSNIMENNIVWTGGGFGVTGDGLYLNYSNNNKIENNIITNIESCCISGDGIDIYDSEYNVLNNNIINYYPNNGLSIYYSSNSIIFNNKVSWNGGYGIYIDGSSNINMIDNKVNNNHQDGIYAYYFDKNSLINNSIYRNGGNGLDLFYSDSNNISSNQIYNNGNYGVNILYSKSNYFYSNTVYNNNNYGINLYYASNNLIYNNLFNNTNNVDITYSTDYWNTSLTYGKNILNGLVIGGNAWLSPNGKGFSQVMSPSPLNPDICNESYVISGKNVDYLPLKYPQKAFYTITFTESGLPSGTQWSVTLNGTTKTSQTSNIYFEEPNGKYFFTVGTITGYSISPSSGYVTVNGSSVSELIKFTQIKYNVTFTENGLPSGTQWSVTLNNNTKYSKTNAITFQEPVGTYSYTIGSVSGYSATQSSGTISVTENVLISVKFNPIMYIITFAESGLPSGTQWSVSLNGTNKTSSTSTIIFNEPDGEYYFTVGKVSGYNSTPSSGYITVSGSNVYQKVEFGKLYSITFTETGLKAGTPWSVTLNGSTESSTTTSITFYVTAGTYTYTINSVNGYTVFPQSGTLNVVNSNIIKSVVFTPIRYSVTFIEKGLPSGTQWSV
ncbi:MAG: right-handed parallel beta-helix repeat-containing protein, partial [bacterium]